MAHRTTGFGASVPLVAALCLLAANASFAIEFHVSAKSGQDRNSGMVSAPFATVQRGVDVARPGDVVVVHVGTYHERVDTVRAGTPGKPITVRAMVSRGVKITASGNVLTVRHPYHVFEGLVIDGAMGNGRAVRVRGRGSHLVFRDMEVQFSGNNCMDLNGEDILIEGSSIHHCLLWDEAGASPRDAHGITADRIKGLTVRDCEIYYFSGDALQFSPGRQPWDDVLVERTRMWIGPLPAAAGRFRAGQLVGENAFDSKTGRLSYRPRVVFRDVEASGFRGVITHQAAFNVKEYVDFTLDGATIRDSEIAFRLRGPAKVRIRNVVAHDNDISVRYEDGIRGLRIENVTFADRRVFKDGGGADPVAMVVRNSVFLGPSSMPREAGAFWSNMLGRPEYFADAVGGDFHLRARSPPVDAGTPISEVSRDRDGRPRPVGPVIDTGAFEWSPGSPPQSGNQ